MVLICEEDEYGSYIGNDNYAYSDPVPPEDYGVLKCSNKPKKKSSAAIKSNTTNIWQP
jgi:hypothetical protein